MKTNFLVAIGRTGSRSQIRLTGEQLRRRQLESRLVARGGGCILHQPGQLAVYPIVPLDARQWTVGEFQRRLQSGVVKAIGSLAVKGKTQPGSFAVWGRSGVVAVLGVAVRDWVTCHGVWINVNPLMTDYGFIDVVPGELATGAFKTTMGCLVAERQRPAKMPEVRAALISNLAAAFDCPRYHLHTGHPLLAELHERHRQRPARAC